MPRVVISGCGFLGEAAADLFFALGWEVLGLTATPASATRLVKKPYPVRAQDVSREFSFESPWAGVDALVHCAATGGGDAAAYRSVYQEGLLNTLSAVKPRRALFTSSTSVYAQTDGSWVDETSPADPPRETGRILRETEEIALASGGYVLRLSGLYGPGRSHLLQKFLAGEARRENAGDRWINQIHRDDAARAIVHLFQQRTEPGVYNVSDDTPRQRSDLLIQLSQNLGLPLPPLGEADPTRKRGLTSKRVSNARLRSTGWMPHYPDFLSALPTLLPREGEDPPEP